MKSSCPFHVVVGCLITLFAVTASADDTDASWATASAQMPGAVYSFDQWRPDKAGTLAVDALLNTAITFVHDTGGGELRVTRGTYYIRGGAWNEVRSPYGVRLRSNVTLTFEDGVILDGKEAPHMGNGQGAMIQVNPFSSGDLAATNIWIRGEGSVVLRHDFARAPFTNDCGGIFVVPVGPGLVVRNLRVSNLRFSTQDSGIGIASLDSSTLVENVLFEDLRFDGCRNEGVGGNGYARNVIFRRCAALGSGRHSSPQQSLAGFDLERLSFEQLLFEDCLAEANLGSGFIVAPWNGLPKPRSVQFLRSVARSNGFNGAIKPNSGHGFHLVADYLAMQDCLSVGNAKTGLCLERSWQGRIQGSKFSSNVGSGLMLFGCRECEIRDVDVIENGSSGWGCGLSLRECEGVNVTESLSRWNSAYGVELARGGSLALTSCTFSDNGLHGIYSTSPSALIEECLFGGNGGKGGRRGSAAAVVAAAPGHMVRRCRVYGTYPGRELAVGSGSSRESVVFSQTLLNTPDVNSGYGLWYDRSEFNMISDYRSNSGTARVMYPWRNSPEAGRACVLVGAYPVRGRVQAAGASSVTIQSATAASQIGAYEGLWVKLESGMGEPSVNRILGYDPKTYSLVLETPWRVRPTDSTQYVIWVPTRNSIGLTAPASVVNVSEQNEFLIIDIEASSTWDVSLVQPRPVREESQHAHLDGTSHEGLEFCDSRRLQKRTCVE